MKLSLKMILISWAVLFTIVGGLFYSAYSRLQPESFVTLIKEQIEKNYPGASLNVGNVDYSMAVDFSLHMKNLLLTRSGKVLGSIGEMEVKIPWWLLLLNRGSAHITLSNLEIFVDHNQPEPIVESPATPVKDSRPSQIRVVLPGYLSDAKYTIKAKNISFRDSITNRRYFRLSKLLVREIQYEKNSAFELNIPIEISHKGSVYNSDLWLFGDLTPSKNNWQLNYRGEFKTQSANDKLQMEDLIIDGKANFNPSHLNIDSKLELLVEKKSVGEGFFKANDKELLVDVKLVKFPMSFLEMIEQEIKNPYLTKISGKASGSFKLSKKSDDEFAHLKGHLGFSGPITFGDTNIDGKWKLLADDTKWEASFISPKGEVSFFRRSIVDLNLGQVTQFSEEIGFSGIDFKTASHPVMALGDLISYSSAPFFSSTISIQKCSAGKVLMNGDVRYGATPDEKYYSSSLLSEKSALTLNYQQKQGTHQVFLETKDFPISEDLKIFQPYLTSKKGELTGKLEGKWTNVWTDGTWLTNIKFSKLESLAGLIPEHIFTYTNEFNLSPMNFIEQSWNISLKNSTLSITSLLFENLDPAKITGTIFYTPKNKSFLVLNYPKNRAWKPVRRELVPMTAPIEVTQ